MDTVFASVSQHDKHRRCPQQWAFSYLDRLEKDYGDQPPLQLWAGTAWHAMRAADEIAKGTRLGSLKYCPDKLQLPGGEVEVGTSDDDRIHIFNTVVHELEMWEETWLAEDIQSLIAEKFGKTLVERLLDAQSAYEHLYGEVDAHRIPLGIEVPYSIQLFDNTEEDGNEYWMRGLVDSVYYDREKSVTVVRDYKTTLRTLDNYTVGDIGLRSQLHVYAWAISNMVDDWDIAIPSVVEYDYTRLAAPTTPQLTQTGTLKKNVTDFDYLTYVEWAAKGHPYPGRKKDGSGAGVYTIEEKVAQQLDSPAHWAKYLKRDTEIVSHALVQAHLESCVHTTQDMLRSKALHSDRGHAARNFGSACNSCDFSQLCLTQLRGGVAGDYPLEEMGLRKKPAPTVA